jgi:hypothetical protein
MKFYEKNYENFMKMEEILWEVLLQDSQMGNFVCFQL